MLVLAKRESVILIVLNGYHVIKILVFAVNSVIVQIDALTVKIAIALVVKRRF